MIMKKKIKPFYKLSDSEKRVTIAKDVIKQIKLDKIRPKNLVYISSKTIQKKLDNGLGTELLPLLEKYKCQACALGSIMVCDILKTDEYKTDYLDNIDSDEIKEKVRYFSRKQLDLIECSFERSILHSNLISARDKESIKTYIKRHKDELSPIILRALLFKPKIVKSKERLIAIMKNIIKNNGTFIP